MIDDDLNHVATCSSVRDAVSLAKDIAAGRMIKSNRQTCIRNDMLWFEPETCYELVGLDKDGNEKNDEDVEEDEAED